MAESVVSVRSLATIVLGRVAPHEGPALSHYLDAYESDPTILDLLGHERETPTALGDGAQALLPYVVLLSHFVVAAIALGVGQAVQEHSHTGADRVLKQLGRLTRRRESPHSQVPPPALVRRLAPDEVERIRQACVDQARKAKLPKQQAELLADAIAGALVREPK